MKLAPQTRPAAHPPPCSIWKFAVYWWAFVGISSAVTVLVSTLVFPVTAGGAGVGWWVGWVGEGVAVSTPMCRTLCGAQEGGQALKAEGFVSSVLSFRFLCDVAPSVWVAHILAGYVVRKKLAKAIKLEGAVLSSVVALMTSELDSHTGLLKAAMGEASVVTGIDAGLEAAVLPLHAKSGLANQSLQVGWVEVFTSSLSWVSR